MDSNQCLYQSVNLVIHLVSDLIPCNAPTQIYRQAASLGLLTDTSASQGVSSLASNGQTVTRFAPGGNFSAGQPFIFNEPGSTGRETVNIGGMKFGSDKPALVFPLVGGSVDPGKSGSGNNGDVTLYQTNNLPSGIDARAVTEMINNGTRAVLREYLQ
jgi:hypothetical protein